MNYAAITKEETLKAQIFADYFDSKKYAYLPNVDNIRYYHETTRNNRKAPLDASFYDIREFFQRRNERGTMNTKSSDDTYTALLAELRAAQKSLAQKIAPKIYEYGFLRG